MSNSSSVSSERNSAVSSSHYSSPTLNWLQVLGTTERSQVDQRVRHHLHAIVPLLDMLEPQKEPLEFIFPGKTRMAWRWPW
jgi:hypothetical protein